MSQAERPDQVTSGNGHFAGSMLTGEQPPQLLFLTEGSVRTRVVGDQERGTEGEVKGDR